MSPIAIGIGAQKCMTTWLHNLAAAHPAIVASDPKEVDFFSYYFDRGYRWYEGHFAPSPGGAREGGAEADSGRQKAVRFECSPSYLHDPRAPERAAAFDPDMRIVITMRDPIERAFSNHLHEVIKGHIPGISFHEGLANNPSYIEQGLYGRHLARWLGHFPRDQVLCLVVEEVSRDLPAAAGAVFRHLGVPQDFRSGLFEERRNESDRPRLAWLRTALRGGGDAARRAGLEESLMRIKRVPGISHLIRANSVAVRGEVPPMTEDDRRRLADVFADDSTLLSNLLVRPLPWQRREASAA